MGQRDVLKGCILQGLKAARTGTPLAALHAAIARVGKETGQFVLLLILVQFCLAIRLPSQSLAQEIWCPHFNVTPTYPEFYAHPRYSVFSNIEKSAELIGIFNTSRKDVVLFFSASFNSKPLVQNYAVYPPFSNGIQKIVPFNLQLLPENQYSTIDCTVANHLGEKLWTYSLTAAKFEPYKHQVKIDYTNYNLVVESKPFWINGFYLWFPGLFPTIEVGAQHGFNTLLLTSCPDLDCKWKESLDRAYKAQIKVLVDIHIITQQAPSEQKTQQITHCINQIKSHPALLGYYMADEPDGFADRYPVEYMLDSQRIIKSLDPHHPTFAVFNCEQSIPQYVHIADVLMTDIYTLSAQNPVACNLCDGTVNAVSKRIDNVLSRMIPRKPFLFVPQAYGDGEWWTREPSIAEERVMAYLSIIHRISGILYFIYGPPVWPNSLALWSGIEILGAEIQALSPFFLSTEEQPSVSVVYSNSILDVGAFHYKGHTLVLVANTENKPSMFKLRIQQKVAKQATVMFENRMVDLESNELVDMIDRFGTRVYRIPDASDNSKALPYYHVDLYQISNPSFELQTNPGWPDSYRRFAANSDIQATFANFSSATSLSDNDAHSGFYSFRFSNPDADKLWQLQAFYVILNGSSTYELSIWAKTEQDAYFKFTMTGCGSEIANCTIFSNVWQTCKVTCKINEAIQTQVFITAMTTGIVWLDDLYFTKLS